MRRPRPKETRASTDRRAPKRRMVILFAKKKKPAKRRAHGEDAHYAATRLTSCNNKPTYHESSATCNCQRAISHAVFSPRQPFAPPACARSLALLSPSAFVRPFALSSNSPSPVFRASAMCHLSSSSSSGCIVPQMIKQCNGPPKSTSSSSLEPNDKTGEHGAMLPR